MEPRLEGGSSAADAVESLLDRDYVEIVAHADADGVSTAALVALSLEELGVGFGFRAVREPSDVRGSDADVYCDLGAAYVAELSDCIVVDHHMGGDPRDDVVWMVDSDAPASAVVAHALAAEAGVDRPDVALLGAEADDGAPAELADRGLELGLVGRRMGVRLASNDPVDALWRWPRPYTELTGDEAAARAFVEELGLEEEFDRAAPPSEEALRVLGTAVTALAAKTGRPDAVESLTGEVYALRRYGSKELHALSHHVDLCARAGKPGLAFSAVLRGRRLDDVERVARDHASRVVEAVDEAHLEEQGGFYVVEVESCPDVSSVADVYFDWVLGGSDLVVVDVGRGKASLRSTSFDCSCLASEAAERVEGSGGGHLRRAGASFEAVRYRAFLRALREAVER